ncbi:MAG: protein YgfX [Pseudomonadota bacterium]|nr:protein YgfX [Pseudomonadota bacterium]HJO36192.1 protein YgfX [Gammaproteobacteria bacterium]
MSSGFASSRHFELARSRLLAGAIFALGLTCAGLLGRQPWPLPLRLAAIVMLAAFLGGWLWRRSGGRRIRRLQVTRHGWRLHEAGGATLAATLQPDSLLTRRLLVLNFRLDGRRRSRAVVVLPDSLPPAERRRLLVLARFDDGAHRPPP